MKPKEATSYDHSSIEKKWQEKWTKENIYKVEDSVEGKGNHYVLVEFTYPSGDLHVGHWYAFAVPDIYARYKRMQGFNVLYPMGFDAFGLPAENAAIKEGADPKVWTYEQMDKMRAQLRSMGTMFDWDREVVSCDPKYYKWTQWMFNQFLKNDLVHKASTKVNWCPKDQTILANEQVIDGCCERCGSDVVQRNQDQWMLRISKYADRLIDDLDQLNWPEEIKSSQRNWIGRSEGSELDFKISRKYKYVLLHGFQGSPDEGKYAWLKTELEKQGHEVICPLLPNTDSPKEDEQVSLALSTTTYDKNTILYGHSLGSVVAMKVLEKLENPIAGVVLSGAFCDPNFDDDLIFKDTFEWKFDVDKIKSNAGFIKVIRDIKDDAVLPEQYDRLEAMLGIKAKRVTAELPHFDGQQEPELLNVLSNSIKVFTTRADTLFGVTYVVLAPEHELVESLKLKVESDQNRKDIEDYLQQTKRKSELERQQSKEKTGVELKGIKAINPANGEEVPVWIADYVLAGYGTGAVMAVPAHDERDFEFATTHNLTITPVVTLNEKIDKKTKNLEKEFEKFLKFANKNSKTPFIIGGFAGRIFNGFAYRNHKDVDVFIKEEDFQFWKDYFLENGYEDYRESEDNKRDYSKYALYIKNIDGEDIEFDFWVVDQDDKGRFVDNEWGKKRTWNTKIEDVKESIFNDMKVFISTLPMYFEHLDTSEKRLVDASFYKKAPYISYGMLVNSGTFNGLSSEEAKKKITEFVGGKFVNTYRLRDWGISRQRYWGTPIPIVYDPDGKASPVPDEHLPWLLPTDVDHTPDGTAPLARSKELFERTEKIFGKGWRPEVETMDTFVDSSWYFYRYLDNSNDDVFADPQRVQSWMPVDLYMGGAEHTTMHLLYSRFWVKALFDLGLVKDEEAYKIRRNRGLILGPDGNKMSKSKGNVINPDEIVDRLGADTVRMYLAFMGPYGVTTNYPWDPNGVVGVRRFLERVWKLKNKISTEEVNDFSGPRAAKPGQTQKNHSSLSSGVHKTIKKIGEDIEGHKYNTAIAQMMILLNEWDKQEVVSEQEYKTLLQLLAPFAPHMTEELWYSLGEQSSIHFSFWPTYDEEKIIDKMVTIGVQINGKIRAELQISATASEDEIQAQALAIPHVQGYLKGQTPKKVVVVPRRVINIVV